MAEYRSSKKSYTTYSGSTGYWNVLVYYNGGNSADVYIEITPSGYTMTHTLTGKVDNTANSNLTVARRTTGTNYVGTVSITPNANTHTISLTCTGGTGGQNATLTATIARANRISFKYKPGFTTSYNTTKVINGTTYYVGTVSSGGYLYQNTTNTKTTREQYAYYQGNEWDPINNTSFALSRTGYTFSGWKGSNDGYVYDQDDTYDPEWVHGGVSSGDVSVDLTAQWTANTYTVTYNSNGGSGSMAASTATYGQGFKTKQNAFSRTGYTFNGWREDNATSGTYWGITSSYSGTYESGKNWTWNYTKNITLYAQWTPHTYTINYYGNGSTGGSTASSSHTYGVAKNLTANGFTRAYTVTFNKNHSSATSSKTSQTATYTFKNWNKNSSGTSTSYTNQQSVSNLTSTNNGTVSLYAQWNSASVTFPTAAQCKRTGYVLAGFSTSSSTTSATYAPGESYTPTANITFYAVWKPKKLTVRFNKNGGTAETARTQTFIYGQTGNRFGYDTSGSQLWPATSGSYAASYGFGTWYREGYKVLGWGTTSSSTTVSKATYDTVTDTWINSQVGDAETKTIDLYIVWDYNGTVRIYDTSSGKWKMAIPYVYTSSGWKMALPYVNTNGTAAGWKMCGG